MFRRNYIEGSSLQLEGKKIKSFDLRTYVYISFYSKLRSVENISNPGDYSIISLISYPRDKNTLQYVFSVFFYEKEK